MKTTTIHLAAAFDQNYLTPFYVLLTSIFQNNKENAFYFHIIATGISSQEKENILRFVQQHRSAVAFYAISPADTAGLALPQQLHFTVAAYYRLFFPALVPASVDKLLYLDTDTVVVGDLAALYETNVGSYALGAVPEVRATKNRPDLGIYEIGSYFNSGVLLLNTLEWKKQKITEQVIQFIRDFPEKIIFVDQDALNVVIRNNYVKLSGKYNILPFDIPRSLPKRHYNKFLTNKVIIHYSLKSHKPWNQECSSKFRHLYFHYLHQSPKAPQSKLRRVRLTTRASLNILRIWAFETMLNLPRMSLVAALLLGEDIDSFM